MKKLIFLLPVLAFLSNSCKCPDKPSAALGHPNNGAITAITPAGVMGGTVSPVMVAVNPPGQSPNQGNPVEIFLYTTDPAHTVFRIHPQNPLPAGDNEPYPQDITVSAGQYIRPVLMPDSHVPDYTVTYGIMAVSTSGTPFNTVTSGPNPASQNQNYQSTMYSNGTIQAYVIVGDQAIFQ